MSNIKATLTPQKKISVTQYKIDAQSITLGSLLDVNTTGATDGSVLVFNGNTVSFEATTEIKNKNTQVNGGHF